MQKTVLPNGLTLITKKLPARSVSIVVTSKVGSNYETDSNNGISHFLEHMLFEGTKKRPSARIIANEIESLGGEINAYTSAERTCFWVKLLGKHFYKGLDLMADIIQNPLFDKKAIEKERKIVLKEINMVTDEPRFHKWIMFQKILFKKHPARRPTYGDAKAIKVMKKQDFIDYHKKYYAPNNLILTIVGNIPSDAAVKAKKAFNIKKGKDVSLKKVKEPAQRKIERSVEKRKILNSYLVLGYKTASRNDKDSYILDVVQAILGRGQSGRIFDEIRNKRGLAYEVGVQNEALSDHAYFAVYLNTDRSKIDECVKVILSEFDKLKKGELTEKELDEAKEFLEGSFYLDNEDTHQLADTLAYWETIKDSNLVEDYIKKIKKVSKKDIVNVAKKYLTKNYALAVVEQRS